MEYWIIEHSTLPVLQYSSHSNTPDSFSSFYHLPETFPLQKISLRYVVNFYRVTLIPEVISKIGNKIAITMKPTTPPMNRITTGSMMEVREAMVASTSSS